MQVCLAAADDVTRQRCVHAIQAASAGGCCSSLQDIASSVALTHDLIGMQSLPALNAVLAALGKAAAKGLDANSLKRVGFDCSSLVRAGFDAAALKGAGFDCSSLVRAGFDLSSLVKAGFDAAALKREGFDLSSLVKAGFDAAALNTAGFSIRDITFAGCMTECCVVR
jgi:hypothetical protein